MTIRFFKDTAGGASTEVALLLAAAMTAGTVLVPRLAEVPQAALAAALADANAMQGGTATGPDPAASAPAREKAPPGTCP